MGNYQYLAPQNVNNTASYGAVQPGYASQPTAAGVNINIQNPTATTSPVNGAYNGLPQAYPQNYYVQQPINNYYPNNNQNPNADASATANIAASPVTENAEKADETKDKKKKEIVELTDDYIKTLENYLRNEDKEVRIMGAKELLQRFKEEKTRKTDASLNSLLNLTLQDPSSDVRALGLTMLNSEYAGGDNNTVQLLQNMQQSSGSYGMDAIEASNALLKISGNKIEVPDNSHEEPKNDKKE